MIQAVYVLCHVKQGWSIKSQEKMFVHVVQCCIVCVACYCCVHCCTAFRRILWMVGVAGMLFMVSWTMRKIQLQHVNRNIVRTF